MVLDSWIHSFDGYIVKLCQIHIFLIVFQYWLILWKVPNMFLFFFSWLVPKILENLKEDVAIRVEKPSSLTTPRLRWSIASILMAITWPVSRHVFRTKTHANFATGNIWKPWDNCVVEVHGIEMLRLLFLWWNWTMKLWESMFNRNTI